MYLNTKNAMIDAVASGLNDAQYKVAINKRFIFGFDAKPLKYEQIDSLNLIVRNLDNPMLKGVEFSLDMSIDLFDRYISRLLYVFGQWEFLCHYNLLVDFDFENCKFYCKKYDTFIDITYFFNNMVLRMHVDDQKIAIKTEQIIYQEKEF